MDAMVRTVCVLLHANGLCKEVWSPFAHDLARLLGAKLQPVATPRPEVLSWRVASLQLLALDILGHGAARAQALAPAQVDWLEFSHQLEEVLKECVPEAPQAPEIIGVGHSLGGGTLLLSQALGQQRFSRLCVFEPMYLFVEERISRMANVPLMSAERPPPLVPMTLKRRSVWPSRQEAEEDLSKKTFYAAWDSRARQAYFDGGLIGNQPVELACPPRREAAVFSSGVPVALLEALRRPKGLNGCALHVALGSRDTMWSAPVAQEIFGALRPAPRIAARKG
ncbi:unnamed protein product [Effrenium voratum]|nr:unnamed protein product [Effrenium voratum]